jgi:hypothetical protein
MRPVAGDEEAVGLVELEEQIPAHTQDDDRAVEVTTREQRFNVHQPSHGRASVDSDSTIAGRPRPLAPSVDAPRDARRIVQD